ncbi:MAG: VanZ family protein [Acidobacteria bacterium]|nr:MAG: VanZ family protein [Acidobacteriota bacterium]
MRRFGPAIALSLLILVTAPVMVQIRRLFFDLFPGTAARLLMLAFAALLALAMLWAVARIDRHRPLRYAGLVLVLGLLWLQTWGFSQADPVVSLVERVHVVEYGLLAVLLYRAWRPAGGVEACLLVFLWATFAGTADEWVQWFFPQRVGEIRDVAINAAAAATGVLFALCLWPPAGRWRATAAGWRRIRRSAALVLLNAGFFVYAAHLGYEIYDPQIGRFRSWHTADQLRALAAERAVAWDVPQPPTGRELCCKQDYYLTEAARHHQHRNESFRAGLYVLAWHADQILQRYYAPYLDKRQANGRTPRARPDMRRELDRAAARADPSTYYSPVLRDRIFVRPSKAVFLALLLPACAGLWLLPAARDQRGA